MKATHLVERRALALEKKRDSKQQKESQTRQAKSLEKQTKKRSRRQAVAADYIVSVPSEIDVSLSTLTFDRLTLALGYARKLRSAGKEPLLTRVKLGHAAEAVWHGKTFAGWTLDNGMREAS